MPNNQTNTVKIPSVTSDTAAWRRLTEIATLPKFPIKPQPRFISTDINADAVLYIINEYFIPIYVTNKFWLTHAREIREEKTQIIETFGEAAFFFFGEKTKIYNFAGTLLETGTNNKQAKNEYRWGSSLIDFYNNYLRGTKLAENKHEVVLSYKNNHIYGYLINLNTDYAADAPNIVNFSFSMIVRKHGLIDYNNLEDMYSYL